jgi:hypothetical protein
MQAVQVFIPSELVVSGEAVLVYGPDADGVLDTTQVMQGGRVVPIAQERAAPGLQATAFSGAATRGREEPMQRVLSKPLGPGVHEFAFQTASAETDTIAAGISPTAKVYLETAPPEVAGITPEEALVGGKLRFAFARREY